MTTVGAARFRPAPAKVEAAPPTWGWLAPLALVAALGLLILAVAYSIARGGSSLAEPLFWAAFVIIGAPILVRLVSSAPSVRERIGLVIVLGLALFLVHLLRSPLAFTGYDELQHLRSLTDQLRTGHLFGTNPLLDVSPLFPGLETITGAVVLVSGADPFTAAIVVLGFVRILFSVALYALYREASGSDRVAGLATGIYMLNPNFTFFDSQFAYESLALPLVPAILFLVAARSGRSEHRRLSSVALVAAIATLVITHHVTSFEATGLLLVWVVINIVRGHRDRYRTGGIVLAAGLLVMGVGAWLLNVAQLTIGYLAPPLTAAVSQLVRLLSSGQGRTLFQSSTGAVAPIWERLSGLGMAGILTGALPIGLVAVIRRLRGSSLALLLSALALAYPASLVGRLTPTGSEAAGRSLAFIFLGLAFVVGVATIWLIDLAGTALADPSSRVRRAIASVARPRLQVAWRAAFTAGVVVLVLGGVVSGSAPETRLPGPYLVGADSRSIDAVSVQTAVWSRAVLGPNRRVVADRVNRLLLGAYGDQFVVFPGSDGVEEWQVFLSHQVGAAEIARLRRGQVRYLLIDRRLSTSLPLIPYYYEEGEIFEGPHTTPVSAQVLGKWDAVSGVDRIYDAGVIQLYDVGGLDGVR